MFKSFAISALLLSSTAFGFDFSQAEALFAKRGEGDRVANVAAARAAYQSAQAQTSGAEKVFAIQRLNRLDFYEALLVNDKENKKRIFQGCIDRSEALVPNSVEFYYWKAVCVAEWSDANGILASLTRSGEVESLLLKGRAIDARLEGGGFDRVLAFVYLKVPAINPFGPTRDLNKALASANAAIASQAYPGEADPTTSTGDYFFNAYDVKAQILRAMGHRDEAITVAKEAISRIEQGDLPVGREPETLLMLNDLKNTLAEVSK